MASHYDDEIWGLVGDDPGPPPGHLQRFVAGLDPVATALDVGCGDGRLALGLRAEGLTLADPSPVALERAHKRLPRARAVELDVDAPLPLDDNAFELVLCSEVLEHVRDVQLLLSEIRRVLVPGGTLALSTPAHGRRSGLGILLRGFERGFDPRSPHLRFFTRRSLADLLDELGFAPYAVAQEQGALLVTARRETLALRDR